MVQGGRKGNAPKPQQNKSAPRKKNIAKLKEKHKKIHK